MSGTAEGKEAFAAFLALGLGVEAESAALRIQEVSDKRRRQVEALEGKLAEERRFTERFTKELDAADLPDTILDLLDHCESRPPNRYPLRSWMGDRFTYWAAALRALLDRHAAAEARAEALEAENERLKADLYETLPSGAMVMRPSLSALRYWQDRASALEEKAEQQLQRANKIAEHAIRMQDRNEALEGEVERKDKALRQIAEGFTAGSYKVGVEQLQACARSALTPESQGKLSVRMEVVDTPGRTNSNPVLKEETDILNAESVEGKRILALLDLGPEYGFDSGADEGGMGAGDGLTMGGFPQLTEEEMDDLALRLRIRDRLHLDGPYLREHFPGSTYRWWWKEPPYKDVGSS
jgi:hypothetical protein